METSNLIKSLSREAKPVKRLAAPHLRFFAWLFLACASVILGISLLGPRGDLNTKLIEGSFWLECATLFVATVVSAYAAFLLSVPGVRLSRWLTLVPLISLMVWLALLGYRMLSGSLSGDPQAITCSANSICAQDILILAWLPSAILIIMIRRAAPIHLALNGLLILLASGAVAALGTQFVCCDSSPMHALLWHFVPVIVVTLAGLWAGKKFLHW